MYAKYTEYILVKSSDLQVMIYKDSAVSLQSSKYIKQGTLVNSKMRGWISSENSCNLNIPVTS